jgi:hypothetical protein
MQAYADRCRMPDSITQSRYLRYRFCATRCAEMQNRWKSHFESGAFKRTSPPFGSRYRSAPTKMPPRRLLYPADYVSVTVPQTGWKEHRIGKEKKHGSQPRALPHSGGGRGKSPAKSSAGQRSTTTWTKSRLSGQVPLSDVANRARHPSS